MSFDTARFAVNTLRQWWLNCGEREYAGAQGLLVNADGGGSNGSRVRLWKISIQEFADEINIPITVCHYPPGTSKWNPIEHRMFAPISANWRAKTLRSFNDATQYIRATTTKTGLIIDAALDTTIYEKGVKITKNDQSPQYDQTRLPRRMELHNLSNLFPLNRSGYFLRRTKQPEPGWGVSLVSCPPRERGHPGYHDADRISAACYSRQAQALHRRVASRWIPAFLPFAGMTKRASPNAVLTVSV